MELDDGMPWTPILFTHKSLGRNEAEKFKAMFVAFDDIAGRCKAKITKRLGKGMHTSRSKVLDNAVGGC